MYIYILLTACPSGWYGPNCTNQCGINCYSCNRFNGDCEFGCMPGWEGRTCEDGTERLSREQMFIDIY